MEKEDIELLQKLRKHIEDDPGFSAEEVKLVRKGLDVLRALLALGQLGKWVVGTLATITALIVGWETLAKGIKQWLTS